MSPSELGAAPDAITAADWSWREIKRHAPRCKDCAEYTPSDSYDEGGWCNWLNTRIPRWGFCWAFCAREDNADGE